MFRVFRYLVFGIFVVANAVVASVAVWNHAITTSSHPSDIYLAFLGCLGLAHIFTVIFIELAWRHSITGRVWFECSWVGAFTLLYIAGACATSATIYPHSCNVTISHQDTCISARLLLAFTWIASATLLLYFSFLLTASTLHYKHDSRIFHQYVHKFPKNLPSAHISPPFPTFLKKMPSIVAPKPQRPLPSTIYSHHAGLGSEYDIESYTTPIRPNRPLPPSDDPLAIPSHQQKMYRTSPLYPQHIQSVMHAPSDTAFPSNYHDSRPTDYPVVPLPISRPRQSRVPRPSRRLPGNADAPISPPSLSVPPSSRDVRRTPHALPMPPVVVPNTRNAHLPLPDVSHPLPLPVIAPPEARANILRNPSFPPRRLPTVARNTSFPPRARPSGPRQKSNESRATVQPSDQLPSVSSQGPSSYQHWDYGQPWR